MFLVKSLAIFTLFATLFTYVASSPMKETNSQRLTRGLPPAPPKFGRTLPGHVQARDDPTRAFGAKRSQTSPAPSVLYTGRIEVRTQSGGSLGFVRNSERSIGGINFLGRDQDLHVSLTTTPGQKGPWDILVTNPQFPAPYYVGAAATSYSTGISQGTRDVLAFSNVEQTSSGSVPVTSPSLGGFVESAIWSIVPNTKELKAQYINPDGSKPETAIAYDIRSNRIFFAGDIAFYNKDNNTPASAVQFFLVPV